jgi:hypothetical protein
MWLKSRPENFRIWRAVALFVGLVCVTVSTVLSCYLYIHAMYSGGYPIHLGFKDGYSGFHPVELLCMQLGGIASVVALVCVAAGKGTLRLVLGAIAILNLMAWFFDAMAL